MDNDFAMGYALGSDSNDGKNVCVVPANNGGWGGNGSWGEMIFAIIILAMFAGGDGFGNGGLFGGGRGGVSGEVQRGFDTSAIVNKLDGINSGLCDGFYAMNTSTLQGFHGVDNAVCNLGNAMQQGFNATQVAIMQGNNALQAQLASCCCETQRAIDGVNYNMATNTCALQNTMNNNTRDIIDSQNAGTRAILDYLCQEKISDLQSENQNLKLAASQAAQNNYLVNALRPCPQPAYITCNPFTGTYGGYAGYGNAYNGCGCNSGCGC